MPSLPRPKAGIVACSGEEAPEGTVTRLAALDVLQRLRPADTVTICLPLFLAGGEEERGFARTHPTITVDGCDLRCAARATEKYSAAPKASVVVTELAAAVGVGPIAGRRRLNEALGKSRASAASTDASPPPAEVQATCSCGSGIPVRVLVIAGKPVEVIALPPILAELREAGRVADDALARDLLETVKIYNAVPTGEEPAWTVALLAEYAAERSREPR
jgi:uncharacterized metal-binding protein